jgi:hypothetical protein
MHRVHQVSACSTLFIRILMLTGLCTRSTMQWHAFSSFTLSLSSSYALMSIVLVPSRSRILEATSFPWRCQACSPRAGCPPSCLAASALCRPYQSCSSKHIVALFQRSGIHLEQVASSSRTMTVVCFHSIGAYCARRFCDVSYTE